MEPSDGNPRLQQVLKYIEHGMAVSHDDVSELAHAYEREKAKCLKMEKVVEAAKKMLKAYDDADDVGIFSDHGDNETSLETCPGCRCDVASEDIREALSELEEVK